MIWDINEKASPPDPEIVHFWGPNGPSPPQNPSEKIGGFPHLFPWVWGGEGPTLKIHDFRVQGEGWMLISQITYWSSAAYRDAEPY